MEEDNNRFKPNREFWAHRRVTVTGGAGFLGRYVVKKLEERGCKNVFVPLIEEYDLVRLEDIRRMYTDSNPAIVIHLLTTT